MRRSKDHWQWASRFTALPDFPLLCQWVLRGSSQSTFAKFTCCHLTFPGKTKGAVDRALLFFSILYVPKKGLASEGHSLNACLVFSARGLITPCKTWKKTVPKNAFLLLLCLLPFFLLSSPISSHIPDFLLTGNCVFTLICHANHSDIALLASHFTNAFAPTPPSCPLLHFIPCPHNPETTRSHGSPDPVALPLMEDTCSPTQSHLAVNIRFSL